MRNWRRLTRIGARVWEHKQGLEGYTAERGIDRLVWFESHDYIDRAIKREKRIKRWLRTWKFALVEESNPRWADLYGELRAGGGPSSGSA